MQKRIQLFYRPLSAVAAMAVLCLFAGCQAGHEEHATKTTAGATSPAPEAPPAPPVTNAPPPVPPAAPPAAPTVAPAQAETAAPVAPPVRIDAGSTTNFTDAEGNLWLADQGFADGETIERAGDLEIANTQDPDLYRTEHFSMTSFSYKVPNAKYTVKLHFAETFEGVAGTGERVFSFNVQGQDFNDFDVWAKAGGGQRAYVQSVDVDVTNGVLEITFTPKVENPEINGIEILPAP
jgi:hypothetical protein